MQNGLEVFQSYETIICIKDKKNNEIYLDKNAWDYSVIQLQDIESYILQEDTKTTKEKIKKGIYILEDLN